MSLIVKPFRGNVSVGMKCQCTRSTPSNGNVTCARCSAVRLSRSFMALAAIADDGRSAAM